MPLCEPGKTLLQGVGRDGHEPHKALHGTATMTHTSLIRARGNLHLRVLWHSFSTCRRPINFQRCRWFLNTRLNAGRTSLFGVQKDFTHGTKPTCTSCRRWAFEQGGGRWSLARALHSRVRGLVTTRLKDVVMALTVAQRLGGAAVYRKPLRRSEGHTPSELHGETESSRRVPRCQQRSSGSSAPPAR